MRAWVLAMSKPAGPLASPVVGQHEVEQVVTKPLSHVEKWSAIQTRPRDLSFLPEPFEITPDPDFPANKRLGQAPVLFAHEIAHKFVREEELDASSDRGIDNELRGIVLSCAACDAVHDGVLAGESVLEWVESGVVDCLVCDARVCGCCVGRSLACDGCDLESIAVLEEFVDDGAAYVAAWLRKISMSMLAWCWGDLHQG